MSQLLSIPRELRDEIISLALCARRSTPTSPEEAESQQRKPQYDYLELSNASSIYHLTNALDYAVTALPLFLCNRQLHEETKEVIARRGTNYELDLKFVDDHYLAPTWQCIPILSERVQRLHTVIQSMGTYEMVANRIPRLEGWQPPEIWRRGTGGACGWVWMFYSLLQRFLHLGPVGPQQSHGKRREIIVDHIEFDFVDPDGAYILVPATVTELDYRSSFELHEYSHSGRHSTTSESSELLQPEDLEGRLCHEIKRLLYVSYHTGRYGAILYERFGSMAFKVNGRIIEEIHLGQMLADLTFNDNFGDVDRTDRPNHWIQWKENTLQLRKDRGLSAVEFKDGWKEKVLETARMIYQNR